jgi:hypothetical protein
MQRQVAKLRLGDEEGIGMWRAMKIVCVVAAICGCQRSDRADARRPDLKITPELCDRVRTGMSSQEVRDAIGGPPGFYEGTYGISFDPNAPGPRSKKGDESWTGRRGEVEVICDNDFKAIKATWYPAKEIYFHY